MGNLARIARIFFAVCIAGLAAQQFDDGEFRPVLIPAYTSHFPGETILVYLLSVLLLLAAVAILLKKNDAIASILLGFLFLALLLFCHIPYEGWVDPAGRQSIGAWNNAFKESALAGSAFVVAGSLILEQPFDKKTWRSIPAKVLIPLGSILFSITITVFGIEHFLYAEFVKTLVPDWIPGPLFWTYFAAVALVGSGSAILFQTRSRLAAMLLGIMIFLWVLLLHIPRAAVAPATDKGNELTSVFEALGFSGIAVLIACSYKPRMQSQAVIIPVSDSGRGSSAQL
jgi:uncharacterized membrane protein